MWCLGEYGEQIDDAPYILEDMIDEYADEDSSLVSHIFIITVEITPMSSRFDWSF